MPERQLYAGIDLGSNSFHLVVARLEHGQLRVIDRLKDMVRLAGGLDDDGQLAAATRSSAIASLARFGERIRTIPDHQIRAVGTQTFRRLAHPAAFLVIAETALGCPIDIVSGREEARLVWLGISQGIAPADGRRLIIDIGGGSTEIAAGESVQPTLAESFPVGCVGLTSEVFPDGRLTVQRYDQALSDCRAELQGWSKSFRDFGWTEAVGSSGTIRALASMIDAGQSTSTQRITAAGLARLRQDLLNCKSIDRINLPGLSDRRRPVIAGGLIILEAIFATLGIDQLQVSPFALREGLLHDLIGRLAHRDPRDGTVRAMVARYQVDQAQAARVTDWTATAFDQVSQTWKLKPIHAELLHWICQLHEVGLAIAHENFRQHSAYILNHADMPGFSRQEQQFMAAIAGQQRRRVSSGALADLPERLHDPARKLLALLRLAVTICRGRTDSGFGDFSLTAGPGRLELALAPGWLSAHPLIHRDLELEQTELRQLDIELTLADLTTREVWQ